MDAQTHQGSDAGEEGKHSLVAKAASHADDDTDEDSRQCVPAHFVREDCPSTIKHMPTSIH